MLTNIKYKKEAREKRHGSLRKRVAGTAERPRLTVFRSAKHIYAQVIDDDQKKTLVATLRSEDREGRQRRRRQEGARQEGRRRHRREVQGEGHRQGRLRPQRLQVSRTCFSARRRRARSWPEVLKERHGNQLRRSSASSSTTLSFTSTASRRSSRAAGASRSRRSSSSATSAATSASVSARPTRCPRRSARATSRRARTCSASRSTAARSRTRCRGTSARARCCFDRPAPVRASSRAAPCAPSSRSRASRTSSRSASARRTRTTSIHATIDALQQLRSAEDAAGLRGKKLEEHQGAGR